MRVANSDTGSHVQARIEHLARLKGYLVYHTHDSRYSEPGFPDLIIINVEDGILWAIECKGEREKLREGYVAKRSRRYVPGQQEWIAAFAAVKEVRAMVARPSNEAEIERVI